jgi:hypothetical protein
MELLNLLDKLKMDHLEAQLDAVCEQAAQRGEDYKTFLAQALATEWQGRYQHASLGSKPWISSTSISSLPSIAARCASWPG